MTRGVLVIKPGPYHRLPPAITNYRKAFPALCWPLSSSVHGYGPPEAVLIFTDVILHPLSMDVQFLTSPPRDVQEMGHLLGRCRRNGANSPHEVVGPWTCG